MVKDNEVLQGIREHQNSNIDYVTNLFRGKAAKEYGNKVLDIEAVMLSNKSTAVMLYLEQKQKERENKKHWSKNLINPNPTMSRKDGTGKKPTLGEMVNRDGIE